MREGVTSPARYAASLDAGSGREPSVMRLIWRLSPAIEACYHELVSLAKDKNGFHSALKSISRMKCENEKERG